MVGGSKSGILFDAYGTLFDVYSIRALAEELFQGQGAALATLWRTDKLITRGYVHCPIDTLTF